MVILFLLILKVMFTPGEQVLAASLGCNPWKIYQLMLKDTLTSQHQDLLNFYKM